MSKNEIPPGYPIKKQWETETGRVTEIDYGPKLGISRAQSHVIPTTPEERVQIRAAINRVLAPRGLKLAEDRD